MVSVVFPLSQRTKESFALGVPVHTWNTPVDPLQVFALLSEARVPRTTSTFPFVFFVFLQVPISPASFFVVCNLISISASIYLG